MAHQFVSWVMENSKAVRAKRAVLLALAERANAYGGCWPSVADIAHRAGCKRRMVQIALRALRRDGELYYLEPIRGGPMGTTIYVVVAGRSQAEVVAAARTTEADRRAKRSGRPSDWAAFHHPEGASGGRETAQFSRYSSAIERGSTAQSSAPEPLIQPAAEPKRESEFKKTPSNEKGEAEEILRRHYEANPSHRDAPHHAVQRLLLKAGCDERFAMQASGRGVSPERVAVAIAKSHRIPNLRNRGAWFRWELSL